MWWIPPVLFFSKNPAIGDFSPNGCNNSSLVFESSTKTVVTPCSGKSYMEPIIKKTLGTYMQKYCEAQFSLLTVLKLNEKSHLIFNIAVDIGHRLEWHYNHVDLFRELMYFEVSSPEEHWLRPQACLYKVRWQPLS